MSNTATRKLPPSRQSPALLRPCRRGIDLPVQRIKAAVALMLALVSLPAVSSCLVDASGLLGKQGCCSKEHSHRLSVPGNCDQPCGALASASYLPQQSQLLVIAPLGVPLFDCAFPLIEIHRPHWRWPRTARDRAPRNWRGTGNLPSAPRSRRALLPSLRNQSRLGLPLLVRCANASRVVSLSV